MNQRDVSFGNFPASKPFAKFVQILLACIIVCLLDCHIYVIAVKAVTGPVKELLHTSWRMELCNATALT